MAGGWLDNLRRMLGWWSSPGAAPSEVDYSISPVTEFTAPKRRSILTGAAERSTFAARQRGTIETAADRMTGFTAPKRTTLETD